MNHHKELTDMHSLLWMATLAFVLVISGIIFSLFKNGVVKLKRYALGEGFKITGAALRIYLISIIILWARGRGKLDIFKFPLWFSQYIYIQVVLNVGLFQRNSQIRNPRLINIIDGNLRA